MSSKSMEKACAHCQKSFIGSTDGISALCIKVPIGSKLWNVWERFAIGWNGNERMMITKDLVNVVRTTKQVP